MMICQKMFLVLCFINQVFGHLPTAEVIRDGVFDKSCQNYTSVMKVKKNSKELLKKELKSAK